MTKNPSLHLHLSEKAPAPHFYQVWAEVSMHHRDWSRSWPCLLHQDRAPGSRALIHHSQPKGSCLPVSATPEGARGWAFSHTHSCKATVAAWPFHPLFQKSQSSPLTES